MKAATFGLVLGALSVANARFLEDEDSLLQEEWEDFDDRELQDIDALLVEPEGGSTTAVFEEPDNDDLAEEAEEGAEGDDDGEKRRKWRRNKMRRNRRRNNRKNRKGNKGRKGRKGRKDRKKKKGPFNIEEHNKKLAERAAKMQKKLAKKCARRSKHTQAFCEQSDMD